MQIMLRLPLILLFVFIAITLFGGAGDTIAQVNVSDSNPLEIRFSRDAGVQSTANRISVPLSDLEKIAVPGFVPLHSEWSEYGTSGPVASNKFFAENRQFVAAGRIISADDESSFFTVSFKNSSSHHFESALIAFDFIANPNEINSNHTLSLMFRINEGDWQDVNGGIIQTDRFTSENNDWSTFSMQINIDQIYLRGEDELQLNWAFREIPGQDDLPLFLQRIELYPQISNTVKLQRGSLIITEIMPATNVEGTDFEYIEIYNPDNIEISLRGIEIKSTNASYVIQSDVVVPPYSLMVLSNIDISDLSGIRHSYRYSGTLFSSNGGRIEMIQQNETVANATYESSEPGVALQLDEMSNAYDGYTSLTNLSPAEESFFPELMGSPGNMGRTVPLYRRQLSRQGWYLIAPPGKFHARLNRHPELEYYTLDGEVISPDLVEPFTPVFIYKRGNTPVILYAEGEPQRTVNNSPFNHVPVADHLQLTVLSQPGTMPLFQLLRRNGLSVPPLIQTWDESSASFRLTFTENAELLNWTPFILPALADDDGLVRQSGLSRIHDLNRSLTFTLYDGTGNNRKLIDLAILGFLQQPANEPAVRLDLQKIESRFRLNNNSSEKHPFLYLSSAESQYSLNSFMHLPYEISEDYHVGLGYELTQSNTSGNAEIEWRIPSEIPDEWVISLIDDQTGLTVNMREENSYSFRYTVSQNREEAIEPAVQLETPEISERNRFTVEIKPFEEIVEESEEIRPGSVELRQNYPNPFNPSTNITFYLPEERTVRVGVYNIVGQQVALLVEDNLQAGEHSVMWDASNNPSGIYIVQLETGNRILTRKITLIK